MKKIALLLLPISVCLFHPKESSAQAVNTADSMALVDFYNSTGGPNWVNHTNWLTTSPVYTWFGISLNSDSTRVIFIFLPNNNLYGTIPFSIGSFTCPFFSIDLNYNRLSGTLPASMTNLKYSLVYLAHNQLSGSLPIFPPSTVFPLDISYNNFTFADLEPFDSSINTIDRSAKIIPQADLPLIQNGTTLSIATGGSIADNTYAWYKNGTLITTKTGDSTYTTFGRRHL